MGALDDVWGESAPTGGGPLDDVWGSAEPVNAEGNTYQEAMYGDAAPTGMKLASGALAGISSMADIPELLGGLAYKYLPGSPGFMQPTKAEQLTQIREGLKSSGALAQANPELVARLDAAIDEANQPVLGLGNKVAAGFDYLTGIDNSTQVAPDSFAHLIGSYVPYTIGGGGSLLTGGAKQIAKSAVKKATTPLLLGTGGYAGREVGGEVGSVIGGEEGEKYGRIAGEIAGNIAAAYTPRVISKLARAGIDDIESLLIGNDKTAKARLVGGLDANGNFTTKAKDIAVQVSKKDLLAKDLQDSGFWNDITPSDTPSSFSKKLTIFKDEAGATLGGLLDEASRAQIAGKVGPSTLDLSRARMYADEIASVDKSMGKKFHLELDDLEASFAASKGGIDDLNTLRANWGQRYPKSFSTNKTTEDLVRDSFNKDVYSDFRQSVDRSAENIGARTGKPNLAADIKAANKAFHAASGVENAAFNVQRGGVRGRLRKDVFNARDLIRMGALAGAGAAGAPVAGTAAAIDFARSAAKDLIPIQTRAALKGVAKVADIFDPLTRLTAGGVAGSKAAGEGKYIPTPGAKMQPFVPLKVNPGTAPDVFNASEFSKTMIDPKTGKGVILDSQIPILEGPSSSPLVSIRNKQQGIVPGEKPFSARTVEEQAIAEGQRAAAKEEFDFAKEVFDYRNRRVQLPGGPKPTFDPPMADPKGKFLTKGETSAKKDVEGLSRYEASVAKKESSVFFRRQLEGSEASKKAKSADSIAKNIEGAISDAIGDRPKSKSAGRVRYEEKRQKVLDIFAKDLNQAAAESKSAISKTRMANIDAAIEEARYGGKPIEAPVKAKAEPADLPVFSVKKQAKAPKAPRVPKVKAKDPIPDNVQKSIDELKAEFDPETFDFEKELPLDSENAWRDIEFQDGKYQSMLIRDNKGAVTKRVGWADRRPGYQPNTQRVEALEALTKITRDSKADRSMASGKLFTPEMRDELINLETSQEGLSFRAVSDKTFKPADEATKKFLNLFEREQLNLDQLRATAIGVRTPIRVNGVDVSPYKNPEIPEGVAKYFDEAPLPENPEGGMSKVGAIASLATAGAIGMGVINGGSLEEVALTPENKASERLVEAMIKQESGGKAKAVSPKGASGLMQLMPATAKEVARELGLKDVDIFDPETNKKLGTHYINKMLKIYKNDPKLALAAYNAGPGNVRRWIAKWGMDWDKISAELEKRGQYMETVNYVPSIIKKMGVK